jgi:hypothetical protein
MCEFSSWWRGSMVLIDTHSLNLVGQQQVGTAQVNKQIFSFQADRRIAAPAQR